MIYYALIMIIKKLMNVWMASLGWHKKVIQWDSLFCEEYDKCINLQPESSVEGFDLTTTEGGAVGLIIHLEDWLGSWEIMGSGMISLRMEKGKFSNLDSIYI